jgi:hypothetical protein
MSVDSNSSHRDNFLRVASETERSNSSLQCRAQQVLEYAAHTGELARCTKAVVQAFPDDASLPPETWTRLTAAFVAQNEQTQRLSRGMASSSTFVASTQAAALTTASLSLQGDWITGPAREPMQRLQSALHRQADVESVRRLLRQFNLDQARAGDRSPLELLDHAELALKRPMDDSSAPTAVLIPARQSIDGTIEALLPRRPTQERASSAAAKIRSLGTQCGRSDVEEGYFERLTVEHKVLINALSAAKKSVLLHEQIVQLFDRALLFHDAFLGGLDASKLKPIRATA